MRKLLTLSFILLSTIVNAQWIVQAINTATGETKYIAMPSGVGGVNSVNGRTGAVSLVKSDVGLSFVDNTSDLNKPTSIATQNALNLKQNKLIAGNNINIDANNVISATGGGSGGLPATFNLGEQKWLLTVNTTTTGVNYPNGTTMGRFYMGGYRTNPVSGDPRPDPVFTELAYNILLPNGAREFPNEAGFDKSVEINYPNPGYIPYGDFESHQFRTYTTDGNEHRHHSIYVNKTTGAARQDFEANEFTLNLTQGVGKSPYQFAFFNEGSVQTFSRGGKISGFQATQLGVLTGIWNVGGVGFLKVPNALDIDGYGKFIAALPTFADNNAAKNAGKPINQWYKDNNGFVRIVQ